MDQDNTKGQDKRNWRERLGIGAQGNKDLPKISDDFKKEAAPAAPRPLAAGAARPAPRPAASAAPAVKPAPMAPRANPKAINPPSPVPPDRLAERLRSQREASTKLAEQRVQVARQRAETQVAAAAPAQPASAPPAAPGAPKPKFTFAEEGQQTKPPAPPPVVPKPQIMPPRTPLGGAPAVPPPPAAQYAATCPCLCAAPGRLCATAATASVSASIQPTASTALSPYRPVYWFAFNGRLCAAAQFFCAASNTTGWLPGWSAPECTAACARCPDRWLCSSAGIP